MQKMLLVLAITVPLSGQAVKRPWQFTVEERIALRTNTELARERVRRDHSAKASVSGNAAAAVIADSFDGKTNPELFLPHQVFDELVKLAFLGSPRTGEVVRHGFQPEVERHGLPSDFWDRLQNVSTIYFADYREVSDLLDAKGREQSEAARKRIEAALVLAHANACRSRSDAFAAARKEFGRERFDRFLYEVIAVGMFSVADRLPDPNVLRQAEEGCR